MMGLNPNEQKRLYQEYWLKIEAFFSTKIFTEFLRHYLIMKLHQVVNQNRVYDTYKNFYYHSKLNPAAALTDLNKFAMFYNQLLHAATSSKKLNRLLLHINVMDSRVI
ncbi:hypothetical protein PT285_07675 [Lactobacillus sp. ESL0791]|uniref:hypothetical protein n=1 Tax=Lactobacillus sp. ESL0791 TaxID=2983234 RepID=UPI0023F9878F|nr:hypothetical protein [Lactobacillus sp. ESL0791]MDF7639279.1 hypothetical protein [Lactobacillus sp. ESL0791]